MADNIVIGSGRLYAAALDAEDKPLPERYLGDSVGASLAGGEGDRLQVFAGDGADSSRKLVDRLLDVNRSMSLTLHDLSLANIALFVMGSVKKSGAVPEVAAASPEQFPACSKGDEFQLGTYVKGAPAGGYPSIQAATGADKIGYLAADAGAALVTDAAVGKVLVEPSMADWLDNEAATPAATDGKGGADGAGPEVVVFLDTGRVRALQNFADGFRLSYTPVAAFDYVESSAEPVEAAVRYVEYEPRAGGGRSVYMAKASVVPNGEWPLKSRDTEQQLGLTCQALGKVYVHAGVSS